MKVEYLDSGALDCPLIRIYGDSVAEFIQLQKAVETLASGSQNSITIDELPNFSIVGNSSLIFINDRSDEGITYCIEKRRFELRLSQSKWGIIIGLLDPFTKIPLGSYHQWLYGKEAMSGLRQSDISIVLSSHKNGAW